MALEVNVGTGYANKVELRDGQVMLFHRNPNSKRPIYHMRLHVRGMRDIAGNKKHYLFETTGESDLEEAKRVALNMHDELRLRVKNNQPMVELTFSDLYALWWKEKQVKLNAIFAAKGRQGKTERIGWFEKQSARYWLAYFGKKKLSEINQAYVSGYWAWRIAYWSNASAAERKRFGQHALQPKKKTLDMEQSSLREIFGWANAHDIMTRMPIIENPFARQGIAPHRRASFDVDDWEKLRTYMDRWVLGKGDADKRVNSRHLYQRKLLQIYLHWLAYTGMRTGEVLKLRHRDIEVRWTEQFSVPTLRIHVPKDTKTGARDIVSLPQCIAWYDALVEVTEQDAKEFLLFCDADGKVNKGFFKTIPKLFAEAGVLFDANGERRSAYSLRHFYAEQRLIEQGLNPKAYDNITQQMGTSVKQLEAHYIRKGMLKDDEALVTGGGRRMGKTVDAAEVERARGL